MKSLEKKRVLAFEKSTDNPLKDHKEVKSFEERFGHTHTHTHTHVKRAGLGSLPKKKEMK